jgi:hypothetical protein
VVRTHHPCSFGLLGAPPLTERHVCSTMPVLGLAPYRSSKCKLEALFSLMRIMHGPAFPERCQVSCHILRRRLNWLASKLQTQGCCTLGMLQSMVCTVLLGSFFPMPTPSPHFPWYSKLIPSCTVKLNNVHHPATQAKDGLALLASGLGLGDLRTRGTLEHSDKIKGERLTLIGTKQLANLCGLMLRPPGEAHTGGDLA